MRQRQRYKKVDYLMEIHRDPMIENPANPDELLPASMPGSDPPAKPVRFPEPDIFHEEEIARIDYGGGDEEREEVARWL